MAATVGRGRPLRFFGVLVSGWVGMRVLLLWPQLDSSAAVLRAIAPVAAAQAAPAAPTRSLIARGSVRGPVSPRWRMAAALPPRRAPDPTRVALALLGLVRFGDPAPVEDPVPLLPGLPRALPPDPPMRLPSRWSGSAWLVARGGAGTAPGGLGGQLGGSQAGARIAYLVDRKHRIALAARVTTPLGSGLREAALGVEWQPTRLPIRLVAERRFAIDGGRGGPALGMVGGVAPVALPLDFRLEAYGQAGVIRRTTTDAYVDAAARVAHPLVAIGKARVDLGAGIWGGAQRDATRLDIGPALGVLLPLGKRTVRVTLDWRQRVAGAARPGSGAALTLGTDL